MPQSDERPADAGWRAELLSCATFTVRHLAPLVQSCEDGKAPGLAQLCNQARNVLAHLDWAFGGDTVDSGHLRRAKQHLQRAFLDACKIHWELHSPGEHFRCDDLAAILSRYEQLILRPFDDGETVDDWQGLLTDVGIWHDPGTSRIGAPVLALDEAAIKEAILQIRQARSAEAALHAQTLRSNDISMRLNWSIWMRLASACSGITYQGPQDVVPLMLTSYATISRRWPHDDGSTALACALAQTVWQRAREYFRKQLIEIALADDSLPLADKRPIADHFLAQPPGIDSAYDILSEGHPCYPMRARAEAAERALASDHLHSLRPIHHGQRLRFTDGLPALVWSADLEGFSALSQTAAASTLNTLYRCFAEALEPARVDWELIAANTWGDGLMAGFARADIGLRAATDLADRFAIAKTGARLRIGLAWGPVSRQANPVTLYDICGEAVVRAARLEPCALPKDEHLPPGEASCNDRAWEIICSASDGALLAEMNTTESFEPIRRTTVKAMHLDGQQVVARSVIECCRIGRTST